jgi:hypothetical protein
MTNLAAVATFWRNGKKLLQNERVCALAMGPGARAAAKNPGRRPSAAEPRQRSCAPMWALHSREEHGLPALVRPVVLAFSRTVGGG